jgi:hypothetical protein
MTTPLEDAQAMVAAYLAAETQILLGKEVRMGGPGLDRWLRFEDMGEVRAGRKEWESRVKALQQTDSAAPTFGGLSYSLADFSAPR